jgi:hypothetical protein
MISRLWIILSVMATSAGAQELPKPVLPPGDSTSERLKNAEGVVKPPENIDPQIKAIPPKPEPNSTPVIPPPGTPENRPDLVPK